MRIISGIAKGRKLAEPANVTRPTSDRAREGIFSALVSSFGKFEGINFLDLFAGSAAVGLEALSRGAVFAQFVEEAPAARGAIKDNIDALGVAGITKVYRRDATHLGPLPPDEAFSLVFCDPPYGKGFAARALDSALKGGWLAPRALIIVEEKTGASDVLPEGITLLETRNYGETSLTFAEAP